MPGVDGEQTADAWHHLYGETADIISPLGTALKEKLPVLAVEDALPG